MRRQRGELLATGSAVSEIILINNAEWSIAGTVQHLADGEALKRMRERLPASATRDFARACGPNDSALLLPRAASDANESGASVEITSYAES